MLALAYIALTFYFEQWNKPINLKCFQECNWSPKLHLVEVLIYLCVHQFMQSNSVYFCQIYSICIKWNYIHLIPSTFWFYFLFCYHYKIFEGNDIIFTFCFLECKLDPFIVLWDFNCFIVKNVIIFFHIFGGTTNSLIWFMGTKCCLETDVVVSCRFDIIVSQPIHRTKLCLWVVFFFLCWKLYSLLSSFAKASS